MITNTSSRRENKRERERERERERTRERERERERVYSDTHTHHIPYVTFFKHLTLFELIRTFPISKKAKIFCEQILSIIYTLQLTADKRYARAREISFPFFLSLSVEDRRRLRDSPRRLSLVRILERRPRLLRKIFEFTNRCVLSNSLQFRVRTDAQQRKNKNFTFTTHRTWSTPRPIKRT